jgi:hypothetical protein
MSIYSAEPGRDKSWRADAIAWSENNTEAFAGLLPPPPAGDALLQYHKNLTQFGFVIVVIVQCVFWHIIVFRVRVHPHLR